MFGGRRRRRPNLLGAALVIGASRHVARREIQHQAVMQSQREMDMQRAMEIRRLEEAEQERRTQRAIEEAMKKAAADNERRSSSGQQTPTAVAVAPQQQQPAPPHGYYSPAPTAQYQLQQNAAPYYPQQGPPACPSLSPGPPIERPKSTQGISMSRPESSAYGQFCGQCGLRCEGSDKFCRRCGMRLVAQEQYGS